MSKIKPILFNTDMVRAIQNGTKTVTRRVVKPQPVMGGFFETCFDWRGVKAPYRPGDILYVRETFWKGVAGVYEYKADYEDNPGYVWTPSIHMPREAARIFLRVTDVGVDRLHEITEEQAKAEGTEPFMMTADVDKPDDEKRWQEILPALSMFPAIWDSTIKKADRSLYGWEANPWVWVIEFERCEKPKGD